jgi:2-polyprenyl-3-methyl-5-hydroxy-6-metoxy-1,4-benzoquinol methylase
MQVECPICQGKSYLWREKNGFKVFRCLSESCEHAFVAPTPSPEWLTAYYDNPNDALENSSNWTTAADYANNPRAIQRMYTKSRIRHLKKHGLLHSHDVAICDLGSATGCFLAVLKDSGFGNVTGCEISKAQAEYSNATFGINTVNEASQLASNSIDLMCAYAVLEHVADPRHLLAEVHRILKSDGHLVIDVPNSKSFYESIAKNTWLWLIPPAHLHYFSPSSLKCLLEQSGFQVTSARTLSTSTYTFLVVYHLFSLLNRPLPSTALSTSRIKRACISLTEAALRLALWPISVLASLTMRHNQLIYVATVNRSI